MHYSSGPAGMGAIGGAATLPADGTVWQVARMLLDLAGGLFGAYLIVLLVVMVAGRVMRLQYRENGRSADVRP